MDILPGDPAKAHPEEFDPQLLPVQLHGGQGSEHPQQTEDQDRQRYQPLEIGVIPIRREDAIAAHCSQYAAHDQERLVGWDIASHIQIPHLFLAVMIMIAFFCKLSIHPAQFGRGVYSVRDCCETVRLVGIERDRQGIEGELDIPLLQVSLIAPLQSINPLMQTDDAPSMVDGRFQN